MFDRNLVTRCRERKCCWESGLLEHLWIVCMLTKCGCASGRRRVFWMVLNELQYGTTASGLEISLHFDILQIPVNKKANKIKIKEWGWRVKLTLRRMVSFEDRLGTTANNVGFWHYPNNTGLDIPKKKRISRIMKVGLDNMNWIDGSTIGCIYIR